MVFEALQDGRLSLDQALPVSATANAQPPSRIDLTTGGTITVEDAIYALVTKSANNVAVVVEDRPSPRETRRHSRSGRLLLGLYQGHPLTTRDSRYGMTFPDKIIIYQANVEAVCSRDAEVREEVRKTVLHEIAHHFGIDDARLRDLGY